MGRYRDNAPVGHTCPMIDEVISAINSVDWGEGNYWDAHRVIDIMENIRSANGQLRDWGNDECRLRSELEEELEEVKKENSKYLEQIEDLKDTIKSLESKLEEYLARL